MAHGGQRLMTARTRAAFKQPTATANSFEQLANSASVAKFEELGVIFHVCSDATQR